MSPRRNEPASQATQAAAQVTGHWLSDVRETKLGPMRFEFGIHPYGSFEVAGLPAGTSAGDTYRRSGLYRLEGSRLISPAINEGLPVQVRTEGDELVLIVDESLSFRLRRR